MAAFVMDELGADISKHRPKDFAAFAESEEGPFDLIVSLSPEAHHQALGRLPELGLAAEYWPTFDPSLAEGSRDQVLLEYRTVRDGLDRRISQRFPRPSTG
jgi:protein-tyrosine-phosphatase